MEFITLVIMEILTLVTGLESFCAHANNDLATVSPTRFTQATASMTTYFRFLTFVMIRDLLAQGLIIALGAIDETGTAIQAALANQIGIHINLPFQNNLN